MEALIEALKNNDLETVKNLLENGLQPDFVGKYDIDYYKQTILDYVINTNNTEVFKLLFEYGGYKYIDYKYPDSNETLLHKAVARENVEIIKLLLEAGANANARDIRNETPIFKAVFTNVDEDYFEAKERYHEIVDLLLKYNANINAVNDDGNTPILAIHGLSSNTSYKIRELFDAGANINIANKNNQNILMYCFSIPEDEINNPNDLLEQATIETINAQDIDGKTPLIHTIIDAIDNYSADETNVVEFIEALMEAGANIDVRDNEGKTAISYLMEGYAKNIKNNEIYKNQVAVEIANELINDGVNIEDIANNGIAAIDLIIGLTQDEYENEEAINYIQNNNNYNITLVSALENNCINIANKLIAEGVNVNERNNEGKTALIFATFYNNTHIIDNLLRAGADINVVDNNDKTALIYAIEMNMPNMVDYLINHGARLDINNRNVNNVLLNKIFNADMNIIQFLQKNNTMFTNILNNTDFNNEELKRNIYNFLSRKGINININGISNANKNIIIRLIKIATVDFGQGTISPFYGANTPMKDFIDFGTSTARLDLTDEERNSLNNIAARFDNTIAIRNYQEVNNSIRELLNLCKTSRNIYKTLDLIIDKNIIYANNHISLTRQLNFYGFDTKEFNKQMQINEIFRSYGIIDIMNNNTQKSIINKSFELIFKIILDKNFDDLSQNEDINNACLTYQREKTERNKQNLINTIINNINDIKNEDETNEIKQLLTSCLINTQNFRFVINNKNVNFATLINLKTNSNLGNSLFNRLKKELQLNNIKDASEALNNTQQQL